MKTMDRRLEESGIRKIVKLTDDFGNKSMKWLNESQTIEIIKLIDDSCYAILNEDASDLILNKTADALRNLFESEYCAIGKVDEEFLEDCVVSWVNTKKESKNRIPERDLKSVIRFRLDNRDSCVSRGLQSKDNITCFNEGVLKKTENYDVYEIVLGEVKNTTIIPIRNKDNVNKGFIQFINSKRKITFDSVKPFYDSLLRLILLVHQRDELKDAMLFKKDYNFISKIQKKINNVDALLEDVMKYLSQEFSAGVISYRIPLLVGNEKKPIFFLRDCYINKEIARYYSKDDFFRDRLVKNADQMGGYKKLACKKINPVIIDKAIDTDYYSRNKDEEFHFRGDTLIIPVLRDFSEKNECPNPLKSKAVFCDDETNCSFRLCKYFGVFKLRILKFPETSDNEEDVYEWLSEDTIKRLSNLAKHISILLNAVVEKYENKSLEIFQKELKGTSFTKIKEFDEQCSRIVKKAIHTSNCAIYRYINNKLTFSASSDPISDDFDGIIERYGEHGDNFVKTLFTEKKPVYFLSNDMKNADSIMIVPMIRKYNSRSGVMLLIGKEDNLSCGNLSKTFWEHDKKHIEFIVDVLTRIEESDSERLTFLSQLSHELLRPVTEMVYRNDYYTRNPDAYPKSKRKIIQEMQKNVDMCMTFKYIIDDVEYIYSSSKGDVQYNFEMVDFKRVIIDAIRLSEEEAYNSKGLVIKTHISKMPEKLYIDKSRMMQVVINLLRNAIKYSNSYEEISICYEFNKENDCHEISFSNIGIPIERDDKEKIFGLFYRGKNASEKAPNGSGIGLYLVKQIMKAHGGDCYVKEYGFPTIFTIQIPNKTFKHEENTFF